MKQFEPVSCAYGAPMGRYSIGEPSSCPPSSISLFRVDLLGDYDDGGAYWGGYPSAPLYCARGPDYRAFARASSRSAAARLLRIPSVALKTNKKDGVQ
jgi:hypothetical protein